jgi:hypothetical protein
MRAAGSRLSLLAAPVNGEKIYPPPGTRGRTSRAM